MTCALHFTLSTTFMTVHFSPEKPSIDNSEIFIIFCLLIKIIADKGYSGESTLISTSNDLDDLEVKKFKYRVLARHESFNSLLKNFACLKTKYRHGVEKHGLSF